ncbi:patatin-like phospholipase family protein [Streptomyces sp. DK15]|uniref:patatin-like phospholipase family protein n=1 Tax=Streptomyces sp. DK15 TaxID=2957499 RepID=UPI0029C04AC5|nr:patatin-like phospholipase family protein [Streptomyces sp. DK15]
MIRSGPPGASGGPPWPPAPSPSRPCTTRSPFSWPAYATGPPPDLRLTAVDARSGDLATFDSASGVALPDAVAASCAVPVVWPPVSVAGGRWMDGGSRSTANVHLARGARRVVAITPIPEAVGPHPSATSQGAELAADGALVAVLTPDRAARRAFGRNMLDQTRRTAAARAGRAQAASCAETVRAVWTP